MEILNIILLLSLSVVAGFIVAVGLLLFFEFTQNKVENKTSQRTEDIVIIFSIMLGIITAVVVFMVSLPPTEEKVVKIEKYEMVENKTVKEYLENNILEIHFFEGDEITTFEQQKIDKLIFKKTNGKSYVQKTTRKYKTVFGLFNYEKNTYVVYLQYED